MVRCRYLLLFSGIASILSLFSSNYIYQEFDGNFKNDSPWNFTFYLKKSTGIILYAIDSHKNRILIKLSVMRNESKLYFYLLKTIIEDTTNNICGCSNCFDEYMTMGLSFNKTSIVISCNQYSKTILRKKTKKFWISFRKYPIPKYFKIKSNSIFVWMGNIGYYSGYKNVIYYAQIEQLIGCLDSFYFNNKLITFQGNTTTFSVCKIHYQINKCVDRINFSCNATNIKGCCEKIPKVGSRQMWPYILNSLRVILTSVKLEWRNILKNYILLEIHLWDHSIIVIQTNSLDELIIQTWIYQSAKDHYQKLMTLLPDIDNLLIINFYNHYIDIQAFSNKTLSSVIYKFESIPNTLNIGFPEYLENITEFNASIYFHYSPISDAFNQNNFTNEETKIHNQDNTIFIVLVIIFGVLGTGLISVGLFFLYRKLKKNLGLNLNIYEDQICFENFQNQADKTDQSDQTVYDNID